MAKGIERVVRELLERVMEEGGGEGVLVGRGRRSSGSGVEYLGSRAFRGDDSFRREAEEGRRRFGESGVTYEWMVEGEHWQLDVTDDHCRLYVNGELTDTFGSPQEFASRFPDLWAMVTGG